MLVVGHQFPNIHRHTQSDSRDRNLRKIRVSEKYNLSQLFLLFVCYDARSTDEAARYAIEKDQTPATYDQIYNKISTAIGRTSTKMLASSIPPPCWASGKFFCVGAHPLIVQIVLRDLGYSRPHVEHSRLINIHVQAA